MLKNVSRAAEQLYYTQPAVSAQIRELENAYGTRLFHRVGQNLELTEAGVHLLPYAEQLLRLFETSRKAVNEVVDIENQSVRIGASSLPGTYLLPELIVAFQRYNPDANVILTVNDANQIEQLIMTGEVDVGILGRAGGSHRTTRFVQEEVQDDPLLAVVGRDHPYAGRSILTPADLDGQPLILPPENRLTRRAVEKRFRQLGLEFKLAFEIADTEAIKRMVMNNLGISILGRMVSTMDVTADWLRAIPVEDFSLKRQIYLVHQQDRYLAPAVQSFVMFVSERYLTP